MGTQPRRQTGISALGLVFVLIVLGGVFLLGLKLFPVYMEALKIENAIEGVVKEPDVVKQTPREIAFSVIRRLDIDGVYRIKESDWKRYLQIKKTRNKVTVVAQWRTEVPLVGNLSLVADFRKEASGP